MCRYIKDFLKEKARITHYAEYMESSKEIFMISEGKAERVG